LFKSLFDCYACVCFDIQSRVDHAHWFGVDCLRACSIATLVSLCNIQSQEDCAHWFGIDQLKACLIATRMSLCNIQSRVDHAHWYGIDQLRVCLIAMLVSLCDIQSRKDCAHLYDIDRLRDCFLVDNLTCCARIDTVPDEVLRVRHLLHVKTVVDKNTSMLINNSFFQAYQGCLLSETNLIQTYQNVFFLKNQKSLQGD